MERLSNKTLSDAALHILTTADPEQKAHLSQEISKLWENGDLEIGQTSPPLRPSRPIAPQLLPAAKMPKRKKGSLGKNKTALLHALAHIELNAIDLCWDIIARFPSMPHAFYSDWVMVAKDEGKHFLMLQNRLKELDSFYGDLPAHDGLWESAIETKDDLLARLAIVPMVLEARGLDVTPAMIKAMESQKDNDTAQILQTIHDDEITHVRAGKDWFDWLCNKKNLPAIPTWQNLVKIYFKGKLKKPFNYKSRELANFSSAFYDPIAE